MVPTPLVLPEISISLAPPEEAPAVEPFSPFSAGFAHAALEEPDSPRPALLSPPPTVSPRLNRQLSPLRPADIQAAGKGIEQERFEALLRSSRERNAVLGKKSPDLRKEIAIKVHRSKQVERRALFLSKVQAPPSPGATLTPKTPPESPAIFHYSLPSPGLESPLAVFEALVQENPNMPPRQTWVEQVEFRLPGEPQAKPAPRRAPMPSSRKCLPSLDQITARLSFAGHVSAHDATTPQARASPRLPAFLRSGARSPPKEPSPPAEPVAKPRPALPAGVGRLHFPVRAAAPPTSEPQQLKVHAPAPHQPPASPSAMAAPKLEITTMMVPRTNSFSPTALNESNLRAFALESRERTTRDMLARLRKRTLPPAGTVQVAIGRDADGGRKLRRHSAPPELPLTERNGFITPVLALPGAF